MCYQKHRTAVLKEYNYCCAWCGIEDWGHTYREQLCLDHVKTQMTGGSDERQNLQVLCRRCNSIKGGYTLPKLPPRLPAADLNEAFTRQKKLKERIMPARRRTLENDYRPRAEFGYWCFTWNTLARKFSDWACFFRKFWRAGASAKVKYLFYVACVKFSEYSSEPKVSYSGQWIRFSARPRPL